MYDAVVARQVGQGVFGYVVDTACSSEEDYDASAGREIEEELGISGGHTLEPLFKLPATAATGMEFTQVYRCIHNGPFTLAPDEIDEGGWFSVADIAERIAADDPLLTEAFKTIWRQFETSI